MDKLIVRDMVPSDAVKLQQIIDRSFSKLMGFFAKHSLQKEGQVLVADADGAVIGFVKLIEFQVGAAKYGCLLWIAVHPDFRRKGFAGALTDKGVECLKQDGAKAIFASTQRRNAVALRVLSLHGFCRLGFLGLWRVFGWRIFEFYMDIWFAPGEVVLMHT